jgi:hypothetical protein
MITYIIPIFRFSFLFLKVRQHLFDLSPSAQSSLQAKRAYILVLVIFTRPPQCSSVLIITLCSLLLSMARSYMLYLFLFL